MHAFSINTFLTLLAIFTVTKAASIPSATVVDAFVIANNLGTTQTIAYDINRIIDDIVISFINYGSSYNVTIGVGVQHNVIYQDFEILLPLIPIEEYDDVDVDFNTDVFGTGEGLPANITVLKYAYDENDENYIDWRKDDTALRFLIWIADLTNLEVGLDEADVYTEGLVNSSVHLIAVNTEGLSVDGTTNSIVEKTLGTIFESPNDDFDLPQIVENTIDYYNELENRICDDGLEEIAIGSIISCQPIKSINGADAMGSVIASAPQIGSIVSREIDDMDDIDENETMLSLDELDEVKD